jgi:hypothetical protein
MENEILLLLFYVFYLLHPINDRRWHIFVGVRGQASPVVSQRPALAFSGPCSTQLRQFTEGRKGHRDENTRVRRSCSAFGGSKQSVPASHPYRRAFQLRQLTEGNEEFEQKLAKATKYGVLLRQSRVW